MSSIKELWTDPKVRKVIYVFSFFSLLLIAFLAFQQNKIKKQLKLKVIFIEQKNMLRDELDDLIDEHDDLLDEYGHLNEQLYEKDSIIQQQIAEIRSLIRTKNDLSKARTKIKVLQEISRRYLANIDSFIIINETLTLVRDSVINVNKNINWKNYKLNKQNQRLVEKVNRGSVLEILDIDIKTVRYRNTGREVITRYAKKVQKVKICFTLAANQISDAGTKLIHMQLVSPFGEIIIGTDSLNVMVQDSLLNITTSAKFEYQNTEIEICFDWERIKKLESGNYLCNLIIEGMIAGKKEIKLR